MNRCFWVAILLLTIVSECVGSNTKRVYWSDSATAKIQSANLDGTDVRDIASFTPGFVNSLAVDTVESKLFWTQLPQAIGRSNFDGSDREIVLDAAYSGGFSAMAVDVVAGKMYWTDSLDNNIRRASLNGSNVQVVLGSIPNSDGIALDVGAGKMYWTESTPVDRIRRANFDGSNVENLITTGLDQPGGIALDLVAGKMYFTDQTGETIDRANLDGTNRETLLFPSNVDFPAQIALDLEGGKMYWTEAAFTSGKVRRANLDGSNVQDVYRGINPVGITLIAIIPEPSSLILLLMGLLAIRNRTR